MWDITAFKHLTVLKTNGSTSIHNNRTALNCLLDFEDDKITEYIEKQFGSLEFLEYSDLNMLVESVGKVKDAHRENIFRQAVTHYQSNSSVDSYQQSSERIRLSALRSAAKSMMAMAGNTFEEVCDKRCLL
jgi:hypothetical protein